MTGPIQQQEGRFRARELGIHIGKLPPGRLNAITDVAGVRVGHCTVIHGSGPLQPGEGPARTGVTAILPHGDNVFLHKVPAAVHVMNGFGKAVGTTQIEECGVLETPILLTNTLNVGIVADAVVDYMIRDNPDIGITTSTVNPVVFECNDGYLNDIQGRHVRKEHVYKAIVDAKRGHVTEGAVGAGTGMSAFGWKGGIGTASRLIRCFENTYTLGALVLTNYGKPQDLVVDSWPVGRFIRPSNVANDIDDDGSVVIVLATDAPVTVRQLRRIATRAVVGIVRCGSYLAHGSGDYVLAFSTTNTLPHIKKEGEKRAWGSSSMKYTAPVLDGDCVMRGLFRAAGEATEEAVLNSMLCAQTTQGRDDHIRFALPTTRLKELLKMYVQRGKTSL